MNPNSQSVLRPVMRPVLRQVMSSIFTADVGGGLSGLAVTTDTDTGTIYWVITTSATPPSVAAIKAGTGIVAGTIDVTSAGEQSVTFAQPPAGTYYPHIVHSNLDINSEVHTGTGDTV